jgi:uncharacterized YigZ family protein
MGTPEAPAPASFDTMREGAEATGEFEDRKSRFIAQLAHVETEHDAQAFVDAVRERHHDARHNVPAWRLAGGAERMSDDGEPHGTAGKGVLEVLRASGLSDVCCVVTRYFGGTLLGCGPLSRAYVEATRRAVASARASGDVVRMTLLATAVCEIPYALYDRVVRLVGERGGVIRDSLFAEDVQLTVALPIEGAERLAAEVQELASDEHACRLGATSFGAL